MANTDIIRKDMQGPSVSFKPLESGRVTAHFECYRQKSNGDYETITLELPNLTVEQVSCIGDGARRAAHRAGVLFWDRAQRAVQRIKGEA